MNQEDVIFSYTRKQAVEEGQQVCVSEIFPNDTKNFVYPVYFTDSVWELCQGKGAIVYDICHKSHMAMKSSKSNADRSILGFTFIVIVLGSDIEPDYTEDEVPHYHLIVQIGAKDIDDPSPVITFMFPHEL